MEVAAIGSVEDRAGAGHAPVDERVSLPLVHALERRKAAATLGGQHQHAPKGAVGCRREDELNATARREHHDLVARQLGGHVGGHGYLAEVARDALVGPQEVLLFLEVRPHGAPLAVSGHEEGPGGALVWQGVALKLYKVLVGVDPDVFAVVVHAQGRGLSGHELRRADRVHELAPVHHHLVPLARVSHHPLGPFGSHHGESLHRHPLPACDQVDALVLERDERPLPQQQRPGARSFLLRVRRLLEDVHHVPSRRQHAGAQEARRPRPHHEGDLAVRVVGPPFGR
mmetsp:Transcript_18653/g.45898  ORF Transcript_18653/g.45898 Transcript_18653/m.45898 type:complete len:285 (-) Transcript_18653:12-866(-)